MTDLSALMAHPGDNFVDYADPVFPARTLRLYSACPLDVSPDTPVLFVHHGVARNGRDYRDYWGAHSKKTGILAVSIEFSEENFPEYLWYNFGNLHDAEGTANPREQWSFGIVPRLFDAMRAQGVTTCARYGMFGHSAGGQFVHRMLSFGYRERVAVAISANAGTYAMPDLEIPWPFGLGETELNSPGLRGFLEFPLIVMAGTEDTRTTGKFFPKGPRSMRQGPTRWHRAHSYVQLGHETAAALGTACAWRVIDVPGVGHSGRRMSEAAAPVVATALHLP
ncbi:MAG: alpha/beta hydrolase [Acetobacteraceae bacterium]|nr:alpha/beta hydrolase [Acetobacteraceae bacterium]